MPEESLIRKLQIAPPPIHEESLHRSRNLLLGDLVTAVFDDAARFSNDPKKASQSAVQTIAYMLRHGRLLRVRPKSCIG